MKKQIILGSFLALTGIANAQWAGSTSSTDNLVPSGNVYRAGRVGIGTTSPANKLDIVVNTADEGIKVTQITNGSAGLVLNNTTTGGRSWSLNSLGVNNNHGAGNFSIYDGSLSRLFISGGYVPSIPAGYIGIGTTSPAARLDVVGAQMGLNANDKSSYFQLSSLSGSNTDYLKIYDKRHTAGNTWQGTELRIQKSVDAADKHYISFKGGATNSALNFGFGNTDLMSVLDNGFVGIGNTNPTARLEVTSPALSELRVTTPSANASKVWVCNSLSSYNFGIDNAAVGHIACNINSPTPVNIMNFGLQGSAQPQVWIGNTKPQSPHTDFSFAVAGKMVAQSLYITAPGSPNWLPDYVFANDYKLQNLYEVEKYYKENKHLPEVPSAKEVDENGLDIAEMNIILLKKVEELTIHMVEQQRQIDALKNKTK
ncbi:MAG: hypothetical protein JNJ41_03770 [Bacteroidia bacterium]|nr:hypothetical protein [Bacteroidia bacterium]